MLKRLKQSVRFQLILTAEVTQIFVVSILKSVGKVERGVSLAELMAQRLTV